MPPLISHTTGLTDDDILLANELCTYPPASPQYLLGCLLGYWGRERLADSSAKLLALHRPHAALLDDPDTISGLVFESIEPSTTRAAPLAYFSYPDQEVGRDLLSARAVFMTDGVTNAQASIAKFDYVHHRLSLRWTPARVAAGVIPTALIADDWVNPSPKPAVLASLARKSLTSAPLNRVTSDLLAAAPPRFVPGSVLANEPFAPEVSDAMSWVTELDNSYVPIQGPPGAGKTFLGAHLAYALIKAGHKVGITAMSHSAVENLLEAVHALFESHGELDLLSAAKKVTDIPAHPLFGVAYLTKNEETASSRYNLIAGTTWLFASDAVLARPVDTLLIDEAGQLSLADAVVASLAAHNVILLGDPQQLAQVTKSDHPGGAKESVLSHVLNNTPIVTPDRGVFLPITRRMHPEITKYISERFYDSNLTSHESCAIQAIDALPSGLHYLEVPHTSNTTSSLQEASAIHDQISALLGRNWLDSAGTTRVLEPKDIMVVAPYNDQVDLLLDLLRSDPATKLVPVGTVDKFQGREAAVVFFSMTSSSSAHLHRGVEFLFSPNRLNVAISRARCAAFVVASPSLLSYHPDPNSELLIANVTNFVSRAHRVNP